MTYARLLETSSYAGTADSIRHLPLISVITPSFNQGRFIEQTIRSVLEQDYAKIEYWVIDGGSTDETLAILRCYETDPRLKWISEPDRGQSHAINKGLARATGHLFVWLNSDDVLNHGALRQVARAWRPDEPAVIYGAARLIDEEGRDLGVFPGLASNMTIARLLRPARYNLAQPATFAPTALVRELGGVDESLHFSMDLDLWIRLAQRITFRFVGQNLACFRLHTRSKTSSTAHKFILDIDLIMTRAIRSGLIAAREAQVQLDLFAAMVCLTSRPRSHMMAIRHLVRAVLLEPSVVGEAMFLLTKGLARTALGERGWSVLRRLKPMPAVYTDFT